jgi:hypothetical protein
MVEISGNQNLQDKIDKHSQPEDSTNGKDSLVQPYLFIDFNGLSNQGLNIEIKQI